MAAPLSRATVRALDRRTIEELGLPGIVLMEHAALGLARIARRLAPGRASIVCGKGNNGGDGFALARLLSEAGRAVELLLACDPDGLTGDARTNYRVAAGLGIPMRRVVEPRKDLAGLQLLVDAVFGTGLRGAVRGEARELLAAMAERAERGVPTLAVDIPSGLDADTGEVLGVCVPATVTATFAAAKPGFTRGAGPAMCGRVEVVPIGIPRAWLEAAEAEA